jgi:hypothetical protein
MTSTHALTKVTTLSEDDVFRLDLDPNNAAVAETERGVTVASVRTDIETNANVPPYIAQDTVEASKSLTPVDFTKYPTPVRDLSRYVTNNDGTNESLTTSEFQAAIDLRKNLIIPDGTYAVSSLDYGNPSFANQMDIVGAGRNLVTIKSSGAGPLLKFGSTSMTNFISNILIQGITFEGAGSGTTTHGALSYGMVESTIRDCTFQDCITGFYDYGGIANTYENCKFGTSGSGNQIGLRFDNDATLFYTGDPNANIVRNCQMKANTKWGLHFDYGRQLTVDGCDIETNGQSALGADFGGVYVGSNAGARVANYETALQLSNCWFEGNIGFADIWLNGGFNAIRDTYIRTAAASTTYDIYIQRGNFHLNGVFSAVSKSPNVEAIDNVNVEAGNSIIGCEFSAITVDESKTALLANTTAPVPQTLTGAGAVNITAAITHLVTTGTDALTLVNGTEGQRKVIVMKTDGGVGTLTPDSLNNGTTITFDDVGDCAELIYTDAGWNMIGGTATLA